MRKAGSYIVLLLALCFVLGGCDRRDGFDHKDFEAADVCLRVRGEMVFDYTPGRNQISFNRGRKQFRMGTDTMSDYFTINMSEIPSEEGDVITASLQWTTYDDIMTQNGLSFKVLEMSDDGKVWLWCAKQKITVVMMILN